jgi:hypothetical protein
VLLLFLGPLAYFPGILPTLFAWRRRGLVRVSEEDTLVLVGPNGRVAGIWYTVLLVVVAIPLLAASVAGALSQPTELSQAITCGVIGLVATLLLVRTVRLVLGQRRFYGLELDAAEIRCVDSRFRVTLTLPRDAVASVCHLLGRRRRRRRRRRGRRHSAGRQVCFLVADHQELGSARIPRKGTLESIRLALTEAENLPKVREH